MDTFMGRWWVGAVAASWLLVACGRTSAIDEGLATAKKADALYAAAKYDEAFDTYGKSLDLLKGKDDRLYLDVGTRMEKAFCMSQFTGAKRDLAAGNAQLADVQLLTALGTPECKEFTEEVKWAQAQRDARKK